MQDSTFGSGLPPAGDNQSKWDFMRPLLADPALKPAPGDIASAADRAAELLRIQRSSPLFRLSTAAQIQARVGFPLGGPDQTPGVVVMTLDDTSGPDLDPRWERLVVVFNASDGLTTQTLPDQTGRSFVLHPVQAGGATRWSRPPATPGAAPSPCQPGRWRCSCRSLARVPLMSATWPIFAAELTAALVEDGEDRLAEQVGLLRVGDECGCGDDFCQCFRTAPSPGADSAGHRNICLPAPWPGYLILDVRGDQIVYIEVLYRRPLNSSPAPPATVTRSRNVVPPRRR